MQYILICNLQIANLKVKFIVYQKDTKVKKMLKQQDILILLKIVTFKGAAFAMKDVASALKISPSEVSAGLERCKSCGLIDAQKQKVQKLALQEFLVHGLKYVYPASPGSRVRGIPTAHYVSPIKELIVTNDNDMVVWPYSRGTHKGFAITPLYRTVPEVVQNDVELHQLLAIVDCLRMGKRREVELAKEELKKRLAYE